MPPAGEATWRRARCRDGDRRGCRPGPAVSLRREMAAWIGLVPRQYTTGSKPRLGGIGRRANHYLRRQLIHGARAVVSRLPRHDARHDARRSTWLKALVAR